ncbi:MAG: hypothetical protein JSW39_19290 [Desulfobacterales bacterium]|nr:MAG: hypothetical protein JSW39_19290 [Desulfobacterales bacterium]
MAKPSGILIGAALALLAHACTQHRVEVAPVEVKPIHITIDVNVKVERALDDFFSDVDAAAQKLEKKPAADQ